MSCVQFDGLLIKYCRC